MENDFEDKMFRCLFAGVATFVLGMCAFGVIAFAQVNGVGWAVTIAVATAAIFSTLYRKIEL